MIIGITGTLGSGKGTVVDYLKEKKGFVHYSSSAILRDVLRERGLPETRTYMSPLADELLEKHEGGVLHLSRERAEKAGVTDYILEAIHRTSEADYVRSIGGIILGVDADLKTRFERTIQRGQGEKDHVTYEEFLEHVQREDEGEQGTGPNIRAVLKTADAVFLNNGTREELYSQIETALAQITK